jgi:hypothetical protein
VPRYREVFGSGSYAAKEYRAWLGQRIRPLLRKHGLERQPRIDPATGVVRAGLIEVPAHPAAGIQPTLF